ncbi:hypothetical protein, partial [Streptomyces sp. IBSBF 2394]|uniref:hypothetical protein n=1 Tax=Streptomyces sp. IBSBF 2394 TaxID=2903532 RepID=UPI002FDC3D48
MLLFSGLRGVAAGTLVRVLVSCRFGVLVLVVAGCLPCRSLSVFRVATGRVTGWPLATHEAPVPLREVFYVS